MNYRGYAIKTIIQNSYYALKWGWMLNVIQGKILPDVVIALTMKLVIFMTKI